MAITQEDILTKTGYGEFIVTAYKEYPIEEIVEKDGNSFSLIKIPGNGREWGVLIDENGLPLNTCVYSYDYRMIYTPKTMSMVPNTSKFSIKESHKYNKDTTTVQSFELIYSGKNDMSLNATYKEYTSNDLARPAFFQNLTYQANAKQIRFKDFLIQIHNVTNEKITYTVMEDGLN